MTRVGALVAAMGVAFAGSVWPAAASPGLDPARTPTAFDAPRIEAPLDPTCDYRAVYCAPADAPGDLTYCPDDRSWNWTYHPCPGRVVGPWVHAGEGNTR